MEIVRFLHTSARQRGKLIGLKCDRIEYIEILLTSIKGHAENKTFRFYRVLIDGTFVPRGIHCSRILLGKRSEQTRQFCVNAISWFVCTLFRDYLALEYRHAIQLRLIVTVHRWALRCFADARANETDRFWSLWSSVLRRICLFLDCKCWNRLTRNTDGVALRRKSRRNRTKQREIFTVSFTVILSLAYYDQVDHHE